MPADDDIWFRIGYALERTRHQASPGRLRSLAARGSPSGTAEKDASDDPERPGEDDGSAPGELAVDALLTVGTGALLGRLLDVWTPRRRPGIGGLLKGGAAGAGAAFLHHLVEPLLRGEVRTPDMDGALRDAMLAGTARGLVYAAVLEPRLPGPSVTRGAVYGSLEYLVDAWGGLPRLLGKHAPHRRIPLLGAVLDEADAGHETLVDHLAFAVALSVLYGSADPEPPADDAE